MVQNLLPITDPRTFQILFLSCFLFFGIIDRNFPIQLFPAVLVLSGVFLTQGFLVLSKRLPSTSFRSAAISALSLILLFRSSNLVLYFVVGIIAITSKSVFRIGDKHFVNPTNFAIVLLLLISENVWVSPAQWGNGAIVAAWMGMVGFFVTFRSQRSDIALSFLLSLSAITILRICYLGQPWSVFLHQFSSGGLILFSFFMISDPRSTPNHPLGRVIFAVLVAWIAFLLKVHCFDVNGLLKALFFLSLGTPILDKLFRYHFYRWPLNENETRNLTNRRSLLISDPSII